MHEALAVRFGTSFFNALVTAALLAAFYAGACALGAGAGAALARTGRISPLVLGWIGLAAAGLGVICRRVAG